MKTRVLTAVLMLIGFGTVAQADTFNLSAGWSDALNPNGAWSYLAGGSLGVTGTRGADAFTSPPGAPPIWTCSAGDGCGTYAGWSKSNGSESFDVDPLQLGDIYGHTPDNGTIEIRWTSPVAGPIAVSGGVWAIRNIGRTNNWTLALNLSPLSSGVVGSGYSYYRSTPAAVSQILTVNVGDVLAFIASPTDIPDYIALDLSITSGEIPVPEPASLLLLGTGLVGLARWRKRRG